ncbi:MAG: hypothetical protein KC502_06920 [Myxococcales bacterium]|nr:hypothetical protein [Myxococcales bacterium]
MLEDTGSGEDTQGSSDTGAADPDTSVTPDTSALDTSPSDTATNSACPGGDFCDCDKNDDCDNGICLDTPDGKKCGKKCIDACPDDYTCKQFGDNDSVFVCTANHLTLCSPCESNSDCQVYDKTATCIDYGDAGSFCGSACSKDADCPGDYACVTAAGKGAGKASKQCKLKPKVTGGSGTTCTEDATCGASESCIDGTCQTSSPGLCECSTWAKSVATKTTCSNGSGAGVCTGSRSCGEKGLTACDAPTAVTETCNDVDDDCDGVTDELPAETKCSQKAWSTQGSGSACKTDDDCATKGESCNTDTNKCQVFIGECAGTPVCLPGGKMECKGVKTPKVELCNSEDDDCDGAIDEDFTWKDPSTDKELSVGDACGAGACAGGQVKCETFSAAVCDTAKKAGKETCSGADEDCDGNTDEDTCADGDECTKDLCDSDKKSCSNPPGATCDDKNACTVDTCDKGSGKCVFKPYSGTCDDGNACTVGDTCGVATGGTSVCKPGSKQKDCDDNNLCTDDSCNKDSGCVNLANSATQTCYGGAKNTVGVGPCKAGIQYCKSGKLESACVGVVLPNKAEKCDGIDDTCNGVTDEGCKVSGVSVAFAAAAGTTTGSKGKELRVALGQQSPTGTAVGPKKTVLFGFWAWLTGATK